MNGLIHFKWALTEDNPTIKPYDEQRWTELPDYVDIPVEATLPFIEQLNARWVPLLRSLGAGDLAREFFHPESGTFRLDTYLGNYAWHGRHHLAHVALVADANSS